MPNSTDTNNVDDTLLRRAFTHAVDQAADQSAAPATIAVLPHDRVFDAAVDLFVQQGIQRTSMDDIARRAGLSRVTLYRWFSSKEGLIELVVRREFSRYLEGFQQDLRGTHSAPERVARAFASSLRTIRENPLIHGLMIDDPDLLIPSVLGSGGSTMRIVADFVAEQLRTEQHAGNVPADANVDLVAEIMVRLTSSFLLTPSNQVDLDDAAQMESVARTYLVPMLFGS